MAKEKEANAEQPKSKSKRPASFKALIATLICVAIQLFPPTGLIFVMFGGLFLTAFLIQLTLFLIIYDVWMKRIFRAALLIPLGMLSYFLYLYVDEYRAINSFETELQKNNTVDAMSYDPNHFAMRLPAGRRSWTLSYDITNAFETRTRNDGKVCYYTVQPATKAICSNVNSERPFGVAKDSTTSYNYKYEYFVKDKVFECYLSIPKNPEHPFIRLTSEKSEYEMHMDHEFSVTRFSLYADEQKIATYKTAGIRRITPFPIFMFGCFLNSGNASWDCEADYIREYYYLKDSRNLLSGKARLDPIAVLLGLKLRKGDGSYADERAKVLLDEATKQGYPSNCR